MKKLLLGAFILCGSAYSGSAQTVYAQNFETSMRAMPVGWHQQLSANAPSNLGWQFDTVYLPTGGFLASDFQLDGSYLAFVNDGDNNSAKNFNYDTLYSSSFSTTGYSHLFISADVMYWNFYETATVIASKDGGHTWATVGTFTGSHTGWIPFTFNFDAFANQANVMIGITYSDNGIDAAGFAVDNIRVSVPARTLDMGVTSQITNIFIRNNFANVIKGTIVNYGADSITHMRLNYSIDGGAAVTDAMTSF